MSTAPGTIPLTTDELRAVTAYALACAQPSLVIFTRTCPDDGRPQAALDAAARFAEGARRTNLQRTAAVDARRAAAEAATDAARHAAIAAADASAAAGCQPKA